MKTYKFLQADLDALKRTRDALMCSLQERGQDMKEATMQGAETWHDNAPFEEAKGEFSRLQFQCDKFNDLIRRAAIVEVTDVAAKQVGIGSEITFREGEKERTVKIGSYIPQTDSGTISYDAPVAKILMGAKGGKVKGIIHGRTVEYTIKRITRWI
ncbi:GreA/GreB family elongation factor [Candidatus Parcubacteria bacterium]|nr:GreA/GreB family elongation factor [Candidatus Parcubacteria bacterium]